MEIESITKLTKDLKQAASTLSDQEARYLVNLYYQMQDNRLRAAGQLRAMKDVPHQTLAFFEGQAEMLEEQIKKALDVYSMSSAVGEWSRSIVGIGPVIAAALMAHIDISGCPTAGHIWRYAGLDPTREWLGAQKSQDLVNSFMKEYGTDLNDTLYGLCERMNVNPENMLRIATTTPTGEEVKLSKIRLINAFARRPWNADLKVVCWKAGESFVKVKGKETDVYGKLYDVRKAYETAKNDRFEYKEQAERILSTKRFGSDTDAKAAYEKGQLPKGHIHARSKRYAVKIFLSHWHRVAYRAHFKVEPPKPYAIEILGHAHEIRCPNYPF
ncbi:MAG TPA: transposase [Dongiaceae bacterium]|nr:transposase [Dongiaceae bacterium]